MHRISRRLGMMLVSALTVAALSASPAAAETKPVLVKDTKWGVGCSNTPSGYCEVKLSGYMSTEESTFFGTITNSCGLSYTVRIYSNGSYHQTGYVDTFPIVGHSCGMRQPEPCGTWVGTMYGDGSGNLASKLNICFRDETDGETNTTIQDIFDYVGDFDVEWAEQEINPGTVLLGELDQAAGPSIEIKELP